MSSKSRLFVLSLCAFGAVSACAPAQTQRAPSDRSTVTGADFANTDEPIEQVLQKKVPGLRVTRTGDGGIALQIRGVAFGGYETSPLYMLDGMPFQPGPEGALTGVDPLQIETIKIIKGAEAALYGLQGANGVIVITTKRANKAKP